MVKDSLASAGDIGSIPGLGRSFGEGNGNPLQYFYLGNPMDRGVWWATVHGVTRVGHDLATEPPPSYIKVNFEVAQTVKHLPTMQETWV